MEASNEAIRVKLRFMREEGIKKVQKQLPTDLDVERVTSLSLCELSQKLKDGREDVMNVLHAYQAKALQIHNRTNCLIDMIPEATYNIISDKSFEKKGLLYGIPVSVKDFVSVKGYYDTYGCINLAHDPAADDSVIVKVLKYQGAIPFARTNFPHLHATYESSNPIYGDTSHPMDPTRTAGGSSGGEGALVGGGGSPLGIGTDIGGSVRNPAAYCGCCCIKPTSNRLSLQGPWPSEKDSPIPVAAGLFTKTVADLAHVMQALLVPKMFELDCSVPPMLFNNEIYQSTSPLTIGYYTFTEDGHSPVTPACRRVVEETKEALEKMGHKLVPWTPPRSEDVAHTWLRVIAAGEGEELVQLLAGDIIDPSVSVYVNNIFVSNDKMDAIIEDMKSKKPYFADFLRQSAGSKKVVDWWNLTANIQDWRKEFRACWLEAGLDAVLFPAIDHPANKLNQSYWDFRSGACLKYFNIMDYPAGTVPVGRVTEQDIKDNEHYHTVHGDDLTATIVEDMKDSCGLPLAIQIAAPRWQEELCLRVMRDVQQCMGVQQYTPLVKGE